ncbi:dihydrolipoyl dehydrogenase family protein [Pendulispora albinea]|uniref:NAD(P)/FAD-dependent oxidoreductase n=1 Tax=Pendulispora albinea TaxID=2741071 RepID=A0ABZ2M3J9_9BACT
MKHYDLVAIGSGNTGLVAAFRAAGAKKKVAIVDEKPVGGLCSIAGCNPKKVLVRATEMLDEVRRADKHGIAARDVSIDWGRVVDRKNSFTDPVPEQTEESLRSSGIDLVRGHARFTGPDRIEVRGAGQTEEVSAEAFVVATGSRPRALDFPGAEHVRTTDDILSLRRIPAQLVIVGAGVVAFEFGFVFARLGSEVTLLAQGSSALADFDPTFLGPVLALGERLGLRVRRQTRVTKVEPKDGALAVSVQSDSGGSPEALRADFVLNAAGRIPAIDGLGLDRAGVAFDKRGVRVNEYLRSPENRRVFAGGDAHGRYQLSPMASYEGRVIADNVLQGDVRKADYTIVPRAIFTTPPLAQVGLTEQQAKKQGVAVEVLDRDMETWKVFAIAGDEQARARLVIDQASGRLLGAQLWSATAADIIHFLAMALRAGATRKDLAEFVYAYPTATSALGSAFQ